MQYYLRGYRSELIVTEEVELPPVGVAAEMKGLIPVNRKSQNAQEEHAHGAKKQGVELTNHSRGPELQNTANQTRLKKVCRNMHSLQQYNLKQLHMYFLP